MSMCGLLIMLHLMALWVAIFWVLVILPDGLVLGSLVPDGKSSPVALTSTDHLGYFSWVLSTRFGETLYRFLPRTVGGSFISGWRLEAARIKQMKSTWLKSPLVWSTTASTGIILVIAGVFIASVAIKLIAYFIIQSIIAFTLLEIVNYIEHYGLQRGKPGNKREAFGVMHAWNADHVVTNSMLANLQRHSDHHMHATKPYPTLEPLPGPQLPTGYAGCLILAMVPPLWFSVMHKRLNQLDNTALIFNNQ